jgi:hypothetical protein
VARHIRSLLSAARPAGPAVTDTAQAAYALAGSAVGFAEGCSAALKQDVLHSLLLAHAAANKAADPAKDPQSWYAKYRAILEAVGWSIDDFRFETVRDASGVTLAKALTKAMPASASSAESALASAMLAALRLLPEGDPTLLLFETHAHDGNRGNVQFAVVSQDEEGNARMKVAALTFASTNTVTRFLESEFDTAGTEFRGAVETLSLNRDIYGAIRHAVEEKIAALVGHSIANLPLSAAGRSGA